MQAALLEGLLMIFGSFSSAAHDTAGAGKSPRGGWQDRWKTAGLGSPGTTMTSSVFPPPQPARAMTATSASRNWDLRIFGTGLSPLSITGTPPSLGRSI